MSFDLEKYEEIKTNYLDLIIQTTVETGGLPAHFTIFATAKTGEKTDAIIHVPIPDNYLSDKGKDAFFEKVLPDISKKVKENFTVFGVAWASEGWLRHADKNEMPENWKELPIKKEVVIIHIESILKKECNIYELIRSGHKIDETGNLIDNVTLTILPSEGATQSAEGRFANLLKNFLETEKS